MPRAGGKGRVAAMEILLGTLRDEDLVTMRSAAMRCMMLCEMPSLTTV
ncbi:MAG: hypothetical protein R2865_02995 [Deinococcales bacterium]